MSTKLALPGASITPRIATVRGQRHDSFSRDTRAQLKQVFDALRSLMTLPAPPKRPIGFVTPRKPAATP
jgi:hypothetical protein